MAQIDEIVGKQNIQGVLELDKALIALDETFAKVLKSSKETATILNNSTASYSQLKTVQEQTTAQTQKLGDAEKQAERIAKDQAAAMASLEKQRARGLEQMAKQEQKEREMADAIAMEVKSIQDAEKQNKALLEAKKKLNLTTEEGKKKNQEYNAILNKNTEYIRANSDEATKQRMNIGNYKSALEGLPGSLGKAGRSVVGFADTMKAASASNPFTLILMIVVTLGDKLGKLFSMSDAGGNKMKALFDSMKAIFDVLIKRVSDFFGGLNKIFQGKFKEGAEQMGNAFKGMGEQMANAAQAAKDYVFEMDRINDLHRDFISQEAQLKNEIAKLEFIAADSSKSWAVREEAIKSAMDKEKELVNFKKTEAAAIYETTAKKIAASAGLPVEAIKGLVAADAEMLAQAQENTPQIAKLYDLYGDQMGELEQLYANVINADTEYFEQNKKNNAKASNFTRERIAAEKELAAQKAVAADKELTISKMTSEGIGQIEQAKTDLHVENLTLRKTAEEDLHNSLMQWAEEEKQAKIRNIQEYVAQAQSIGQTLLDFNQFLIDTETSKMEQAKAYELQLAGDNADKRAEIEKKYDKEASKLKAKQARQDKAQALFSAIIKTAQAVLAGLAYGPPIGYVFAALNAVLGAIQIGVIASQPIPQFFKGTKDAPDGVISVAEKGQEMIKTRSGKVLMATRPTLLSGVKGATIYSNKETEEILKMRNVGYDSKELQRTLRENNQDLIRTIKNKKEIYITPAKNTRVTEREGAYFKTYFIRKLGS